MGNCKNNVPCGCGDQPMLTPPACGDTGACAGETCAELFCEECIVHCQPQMSVLVGANTLVIPQGARLDEVLQRMLVFMMNPLCVDDVAYGLKVTSKSATSITLKWVGQLDVPYSIIWQEGINQFTANVNNVTSYTIINLIPDTAYTIKIGIVDSECESVTLTVRTNKLV